MTCTYCNTPLPANARFCTNCGADLAGQSQLTDLDKEIVRAHSQQEFRRNNKGFLGFGCLTLYFAVGIMIVLNFFANGHVRDALPGFAICAGLGFLVTRAAWKRWQRRQYYAAVAASTLDAPPPPPPGLSPSQRQKEMERLGELERKMRLDSMARGEVETVSIQPVPEAIRAQHIWIPGLPGYGKSTLMHSLAVKDIMEGRGLTIIDPAGDLVGNGLANDADRHVPGIIDWIPSRRVNDTIYLDLRQPVPIDFFSYCDDDEKQILVGNLVDLFTRLGEMFGGQPGVRFGGIVRDIIYTLFEAGDTSFIDIYDFIKDPDRRKQILGRVSERTRSQWDRFPNDEKTEPIISRLTPLAKNPRLRTIFGTPGAKLKIADLMDEGSIFLVNIAGASEAGIILGTMIISQLLQAALRRSELPKHRRITHHVYVDEFQNFQVGSDMAKILTQCRKYNLCLTIANQYTAQVPPATLSAVFGGTSTWFLFRMSPQDIPLFTRNLPAVAFAPVYEQHDPNADIPDYLPFLKDKDAKPENVLVDMKPLPFDPRILASLQVGEAIHRKADGTRRRWLLIR